MKSQAVADATLRNTKPLPDATLAGVFNMGGAGVANYVSLLERVV